MMGSNNNLFHYKDGTNSKGLQPREMDADKVRTSRGERRRARGGKGKHAHEWVMAKFEWKSGDCPGRHTNEDRFYCMTKSPGMKKKNRCNCLATSRTAK